MCDFIRVSGVWCGIGVVLVCFDPKSTIFKTRKRNKLGHYRISTLSEGFHCRELIVAGERVLILCACVLTFYDRQTLAAITFPNFLRYQVTTIWLSNWYSSPFGSVNRCTPHWYSNWFSLVQ